MNGVLPKAIIYYGDGSTYQGAPEDAPWQNVQAIAWTDPDKGNMAVGRVVIKEWDIYIFSADIGWHGTNKYSDLMMHLGAKGCGVNGVRAVLTGRWINSVEFRDIIERAKTDIGLDRRSASDPVREDGRE